MHTIYKVIIILTCLYYTYQFKRCICNSIDNEYECQSANCFWRNSICIQIECENRVTQEQCQQKTKTDDWDSNCVWLNNQCYDVDDQVCDKDCTNTLFCTKVNNKCSLISGLGRKKCQQFVTSDTCDGYFTQFETYCQWNETATACQDTTASNRCKEMTVQQICENLYCQWDEGICRTKGCAFFKDEPTCKWAVNDERNFTLCGWNPDKKNCRDTNDTQVLKNYSSCSIDSSYVYSYNGQYCDVCGTVLNSIKMIALFNMMMYNI